MTRNACTECGQRNGSGYDRCHDCLDASLMARDTDSGTVFVFDDTGRMTAVLPDGERLSRQVDALAATDALVWH